MRICPVINEKYIPTIRFRNNPDTGQPVYRINEMKMTIEFTKAISDYICTQLAEGRSLVSICKDKGMPSASTVARWRFAMPEFEADITRAREDQADYFLDKQIEFTEIATMDDYQLRKFQADNLKWVAARLAPKKYSDKSDINLNANIGFSELTDDQLVSTIKSLSAEAGISIAFAGSSEEESGE